MENKSRKYKLLMISDHILAKSGVSTQSKLIIDYLVKTGKYQITVFGGAIKHNDYRPQRLQEYGDALTIIPTDGYGNPDLLRQALDIEKVDCIWFITDPRFYTWIWEMADEIHQKCPLVYWHLWDNADDETWPWYNKHYYNETDKLVCINKLTYKFLSENGWADKSEYLPHAVSPDDYKILPKGEIVRLKQKHANLSEDSFILFYNSRNALRKRTNNAIYAFKKFLEKLPKEEQEKCFFLLKTPPRDQEGSNLFQVVERLGLQGRVAFSEKGVSNEEMNEFYNIADATISLSSEEGFGLSMLESLMAGSPCIGTKTGGIQDQILDEETGEEFGFCLEPDARSLVGSQQTSYIWSHHVDPESATEAIYKIYLRKKESGDHKELWAGPRARESMLRRFNLEHVQKRMEEIIEEEIVKFKENKQSKKIEVHSI